MIIDPLELSKKLISCRSVTPHDAGVMAVLTNALEPLGFKCEIVTFTEEGTEPVQNLYARYDSQLVQPHCEESTNGNMTRQSSVNDNEKNGLLPHPHKSSVHRNDVVRNFCFAGHVDVVPAGDEASWASHPFLPEVRDGMLYGRGASDMKCAVASFVAAAASFIESHRNDAISISLLITGDEEAISINGTKKMLAHLAAKGEKIDACIVGEPTNPDVLGGMMKIGRRGSVNFKVTLHGKQGHVAYPHLADNPVRRLNVILHQLASHKLDSGNEFFQPSNLEIVSFDVNNPSENVIPQTAIARFNIRFNDEHTSDTLIKWVEGICESICEDSDAKYKIETRVSGESFITKPGKLSDVVSSAIERITGIKPELSTTGGTSDARFIKDFCPVVEFGLCNQTAHKVDESASVDEIYKLMEVYEAVLDGYFNTQP